MSNTIPDRRREGRQRMLLEVRCRIAPGQSPEVWLTEISVTGCQILVREGLLAQGQYVVIKPKGIEGVPGIVRWILGEAAGIEFERPLHEAVLTHLLDGRQAAGAYRSDEFVDRFGRRMPARPQFMAPTRGLRSVL